MSRVARKGMTTERVETAGRIREVRLKAGLTQEKMAELLEISLSAYKKIESAENQISIDGLRKLEKELRASADYVLFGEQEGIESLWETLLNSEEYDKLRILIRLVNYFSRNKSSGYITVEEQTDYGDKLLNVLREMDL